MLNMIEWWICMNIPPDEVNKIARFRELNDAQKALMLSARKKSGKFTEGSWDSQQQLNADGPLPASSPMTRIDIDLNRHARAQRRLERLVRINRYAHPDTLRYLDEIARCIVRLEHREFRARRW